MLIRPSKDQSILAPPHHLVFGRSRKRPLNVLYPRIDPIEGYSGTLTAACPELTLSPRLELYPRHLGAFVRTIWIMFCVFFEKTNLSTLKGWFSHRTVSELIQVLMFHTPETQSRVRSQCVEGQLFSESRRPAHPANMYA